jgi:uncharacterized protein
MRQLLALIALGALTAVPAAGLAQRVPASLVGLPKSEIQVVTDSGTHRFTVWIAADDASRARGLMQVRQLPPDHGMLFLFETSDIVSFWMKDTYLSLDMVFIGADGVVANVARDTKPQSLDAIPSAAPVQGVLELIAGTAARIGLTPGDRVIHPAFEQP